MTARIFLKLIGAVLVIMMIALGMVDFLASNLAEQAYVRGLRVEMEEKLRMLRLLDQRNLLDVSKQNVKDLAQAAGGRLTLVDGRGNVLADSGGDSARMENHLHRTEIADALAGRTGSSIRHSSTLDVDFLYVAIPVDGGAARLAVPLKAVRDQLTAIRWRLVGYTLLAFLPGVLLAGWFARLYSRRLGAVIDYASTLATGNFAARLAHHRNDELGILSSQLDETGAKLRQIVEELEHEHAELEKVERIRKDFVINVSHELRTPLASIQGYTETLLDGAIYDSENNVRFLHIIRQNAERLGRLTADLLTLSRVELKSQRFQFAPYRLEPLLVDCVDSMRVIAKKKAITLRLEPLARPTEVFCDSEAVHQILTNLLDNAIKYTPEGGHITVTVAENESDARIGVADSGIGIPADELPRLFERFYRVDKARSRALGGTGLGLAIVKHLALAQGGDVGVESVHLQGSTFWFSLPTHDLGLPGQGAL
jgi:two-component system phosphate regulon sensor histidine kinase PhoR